MDKDVGFGCFMWTLIVIIILAYVFLVPAIELWLWGLVMIPVFGAPALTYWQMFVLNWLVGLFFRRNITVNSKKK